MMKRHFLFIKSIFFIVLIAGVCQPSYAKRLYKWVDENGKTFFSDKVPPTQKHLKRERLNKMGEVVEKVKEVKEVKIKTKEELLAEEALEKLKQQQQKQQQELEKKQKQQDKFLLSTFDTPEFMNESHIGRLNALDNKIKSLNDDLLLRNKKLAKQIEKASGDERNNRKTSKKELEAIAESEKKIKEIKLSIEKENKHKAETKVKQKIEAERYLFLMESRTKDSDR